MSDQGHIRFLACDLDDTLYSPESGLMRAVGRLIVRYMIERVNLSLQDAQQLKRRYYERFGATMRGLIMHHNVDPEDYLAFVHNLPLEQFIQVDPALDAMLAAIPLQKAIFTNATREHAQNVLKRLGVSHHFEHIVDVRDFGFNSKPHPDSYQKLLQILDAQPEECILVDDSIHNLAPAKAMGMATVLVGPSQSPGVDVHIENILLLADAIRPWLSVS